MDDLNHDGRVNFADARVVLAAVERVERAYPDLVGGRRPLSLQRARRSVRPHRRARRARALGTRRARREIATSSLAHGEIEPARRRSVLRLPGHLEALVHDAFGRRHRRLPTPSPSGDTRRRVFLEPFLAARCQRCNVRIAHVARDNYIPLFFPRNTK